MSEATYPLLRNALKARLRLGQLSLCLRVTLMRSSEIAFLARAAGYDALYVDLEHGTLSLAEAAQICATASALGLTSLVRIPSHADASATKLLDAGALGIIAPHVDTAAQARAVVEACKFAPLGARSAAGPAFQANYERLPMSELAEHMNEAVLTAVMLESAEAIVNAEAIAAVPGVDLLLIGSSDLAAQLGVAGRPDHPEVAAAVTQAAAACQRHHKSLGIGGIGDAALLRRYVKLGARFVSAGSDAEFLLAGARARAQELRTLDQPVGAPAVLT
jgi:2-keto-3-deoxy-L-rhamnonate aldolase RhmA